MGAEALADSTEAEPEPETEAEAEEVIGPREGEVLVNWPVQQLCGSQYGAVLHLYGGDRSPHTRPRAHN